MKSIQNILMSSGAAFGLSFLLASLLASTGVALFVLARWFGHPDALGALGMISSLAFTAGAIAYATHPSRDGRGDGWMLFLVSAFVLSLRLLLLFLATNYAQGGDCVYMLDAIRIMAREGLGDAVMKKLAAIYYDDYLWVGRGFPFLYPLARWFPSNEILCARVLNLSFSLLHNVIIFDLARRVAGRTAARVAFVLISFLPVQSWMMLDYTHQYFGALLVAAAIWLLAVQLTSPPSWKATPVRGVLLGALLILLNWQSGIDRFVVLLALLAAALALLGDGLHAARFRQTVLVIILACVLYLPAAHLFSSWQHRRQADRMSSHPISFTARGWNLATLGEYYGGYEQVDRVTPFAEKAEAMKGLIVSQMAYAPRRTLILLPVVKVAKYFLIGYATPVEPQLTVSGYDGLAQFAKGTRLAFAPIFLLSCLIGLWRMLAQRQLDAGRILVVLTPAVFCFVYLVAGETSPRYSFHVHGMLAMIGALAWTSVPAGDAHVRVRNVALSCIAMAIALVLGSAVLPPLIKGRLSRLLVADLRGAQPPSPFAESTPFTSTIMQPTAGSNESGQSIHLGPAFARDHLSVFLWPLAGERNSALAVEIRWNGASVFASGLGALARVQRVELPISADPVSGGTLTLKVTGSAATTAGQPALRWGYVR